ncbi:CD63 antigen-like isoform X2 [Zophobas morio]|uniref:CD63 antigen-like isoform X2 n=1 Tax=Zophobas morio TaxID=2755281 RepID=UPI003083DE52
MNLNWSNRVIKYVLFVFNLLFVITGIVMIAVGVSVKSYYTDYDIFLNDSYFSLPNLLIAIGSLIFFISFFGCCGAIRESWFMIFIFSILLSVIFIMEFSAGIAGYVLRDKTIDFLTEELQQSTQDYEFNNPKPNPQTYMWDKIQSQFKCCGAAGPKDWIDKVTTTSTNNSATTPTTTNSSVTTTVPSVSPDSTTPTTPTALRLLSPRNKGDLPSSCCVSKPGTAGTITCNIDNTDTATYFKIGCVEGFGDYLKDHAVTIGGVGLAIAFIQLFGVIFACHLSKQLKHGFHST